MATMHQVMPSIASMAGPAPAPSPGPKPKPVPPPSEISTQTVEVMNYVLPAAGALALALFIVAANRH